MPKKKLQYKPVGCACSAAGSTNNNYWNTVFKIDYSNENGLVVSPLT